MAIRVAELHCDLHAGAPAAVEVDLHVMGAQMLSGADDFVEGGDFERRVVQAGAGLVGVGRLEQRDAVVVGVQAQEHGAAGHVVLAIDIRDAETQHLRVEPGRAFDVRHIERDMADFSQPEGQAGGALQIGEALRGGLRVHRVLPPFRRRLAPARPRRHKACEQGLRARPDRCP